MFRLLKAEIRIIFPYILIGIAFVIFYNFLEYFGLNITSGNRLVVLLFGAIIYLKMWKKESRLSMFILLPIKPIKIGFLRLIIPAVFFIIFLLSDLASRIIFKLSILETIDSIWIFVVLIVFYMMITGPSIVSDEPTLIKNPYLSSLFTILGLTIFVVGGFLIGLSMLSMGLNGLFVSMLIVVITLIVTSIFTFVNRRSFIK
ncbi:MAG: hypothetical protein ABSG15_10985 [FCB group bacterium]|jgi:hypothetical protein